MNSTVNSTESKKKRVTGRQMFVSFMAVLLILAMVIPTVVMGLAVVG